MTLLSTIQLAKNALFTSQLGIQVASNNIANANTPGYVREKLVVSPAPTQKLGRLTLGSGVEAEGIIRQVDRFLQQRLRSATSDLASGEARQQTYVQLESLLGELSDNDLSSGLSSFFNSLNDVLNQPETPSVRNLATLQGKTLSQQIQHLDNRVRDLRGAVNDQIITAASEANELIESVAKLNSQIIQVEQGGAIVSEAVGLRDKRDKALQDLAQLIDIQVDEQPSGAVNVFVGGDYLVFDGMTQEINTVMYADRDLTVVELRLSHSDGQLNATSGRLAGLLTSRDEVLGQFADRLDTLTQTLIFEFNKIHAASQGLSGYDQLTSQYTVTDAGNAVDDAGLPFTPSHGSFQVEILNRDSGLRETHDIVVQLDGLPDDTTLASLAGKLNAIAGLTASITHDGRLSLQSESSQFEFGFAADSSGVLAALGINTFFTGTSAHDLGVNQDIQADPSKLAFSRDGIGLDTRNGEKLASLLTTALESRDGLSLAQDHEQWMSETAQSSSLAQAITDGFRAFQTTLEGEHLGLSGVNLDEEAVNMITYQRTFQAAARLITTVSEMLDILVNL